MSYIETYFSRVNHLGETTAEKIQAGGMRSFEKWLRESPHTVKLSVDRGLYFSGIILTNKDKEHSKIMFLNVANDIPIKVGDILNWENEKWIIFQKERRVNETYQVFYIIRCNYLIKWIDENGHLQESWCHFTSSLDSKIKDNYRTWNELITPQPNKYAEIIMPTVSIMRETSFIIEKESWRVIEYDYTSVPGVMYLSVGEEKINTMYDDMNNNIADMDKMALYKIIAPEETQNFQVGDEVNPIFTITKNGVPVDVELEIIPQDKKIVKYINGKLTAINIGETTLLIQIKDSPKDKIIFPIKVEESNEAYAYIFGADSIKLARYSTYKIISNKEITDAFSFFIDNTDLASIIEEKENEIVIKANDRNKLGSFTLRAKNADKELTKTISIAPLW